MYLCKWKKRDRLEVMSQPTKPFYRTCYGFPFFHFLNRCKDFLNKCEMKSVYYKRLLWDKMGLSAGERIVYSNLVYSSICCYEESWDKETGKYDPINLIDEEEICLATKLTSSSLKINNPISRATAWRCIKTLVEKGIIDKRMMNIRLNDIITNGYFTLQLDSCLKNELLIFYSWLVDLSKENHVILCNREKLGSLYNANLNDIKYYLKRLNKLGLVERDKKNHLIIK